MDKPIFIGTSILDLSKSLMYDNYFNNLKSKCKDNMSLLYMDTDSFIFEIKTSDVCEDMIDRSLIVCCFHERIKRLLVSLRMSWVERSWVNLWI